MSDSDTSVRLASSAILRYGLAVSSVGAALVVTQVLRPDALISPVFFLAIILTAWFGGFGPGLVANLLATLAIAYFFLHPQESVRFADVPHLLTFIVCRACLSVRGVRHESAHRTGFNILVMSWTSNFKNELQTSGRLMNSYRPRSSSVTEPKSRCGKRRAC